MDSRPTWCEIDLSALAANYCRVRGKLPSSVGILAVVKADAYGHGFMDVSQKLDKLAVTAFAVAFLAEGIQLRKSGIDRPVLLLGGIYPGQERKCVGFNLSTAIFSKEQAILLDKAGKGLYRKAKVHVKIDTGMGRLGIRSEEAGDFFAFLKSLKNIEVEGIFSHFAVADELDAAGGDFSSIQISRFKSALSTASALGFSPRYIHISNSAAIFSQKICECNLARPGIVLYGSLPSPDFKGVLDLDPVMSFKSRVAMIKSVPPDTSISYGRKFKSDKTLKIASVPTGYADGYRRSLTNCGEIIVRGVRAPVTGTVCMDWFMVDVTDVPEVSVGDEVLLFGKDRLGNTLLVDELAAKAGTISYEILCGISKRVPRIYIDNGAKG